MENGNDCTRPIWTEWICDRERERRRNVTREKSEERRKPKEKQQDESRKIKNRICERWQSENESDWKAHHSGLEPEIWWPTASRHQPLDQWCIFRPFAWNLHQTWTFHTSYSFPIPFTELNLRFWQWMCQLNADSKFWNEHVEGILDRTEWLSHRCEMIKASEISSIHMDENKSSYLRSCDQICDRENASAGLWREPNGSHWKLRCAMTYFGDWIELDWIEVNDSPFHISITRILTWFHFFIFANQDRKKFRVQ